MPTENPRITFTLSREMLCRIDEYRFDNRIKSQTQAIVSLIEKGLDVLNGSNYSVEINNKERRLLAAYHDADERAQADALDMLLKYPKKESANHAL